MKKIKQIFYLLINLILYFASYLIPKKKCLWVFGAWFGQKYSDNPKAFFEYVNFNQKQIDAVWISKSTDVIQHVRSLGFQAHNEQSIKGMWYQLRSEFAFVCQSLHDDLYPACIGKKTKVINLWHGLPLKKIMYDVFGDQTSNKNIVGKLFDFLSPYKKIRNDYLLATSFETQKTLSKAFRLAKSNTLITGFPRNDVFFKSTNMAHEEINKPYQCIYMPTFRGGVGTECDLFAQYGFDVQQIDTILLANNIELVLRMHPVNKPPEYIIQAIKASNNITLDTTADLFDSISDYECMITDYSGGYFDFLLTGRPIIFAPFDLEKYKKQERDLYYRYEDVTLKPYAYTWQELIHNIVMVKQGNLPQGYQEAYEALKQRFHMPLDKDVLSFSDQLYQSIKRL